MRGCLSQIKRIINNAARYMKRKMRKIYKRVKFKLGDLVIVRSLRYTSNKLGKCAKLMYPYEGPFEISKVLNENTYELRHTTGNITRGKFHISLLYPYTPSLNKELSL